MRIFLSLVFVYFACLSATAQNIPIDFEADGNGADWVWTTFENDTNPALEIVTNPDMSGLNPSLTVAKFTALQTGQPFAGCESLHGAGIGTFVIDEASSIIRIMVWKPVISDVGIKLVREDGWSLGEIKVANTLTNEWEQIEFDFSAHIGNAYDQIVIFPDFSDRSADNVVYFDNIYGEGLTSTNTLTASSMQLFPNPAIHSITITSDERLSSYEIFSITGQRLAAGENIDDTTISIQHLPKGIYLLKASGERGNISKRFVKE